MNLESPRLILQAGSIDRLDSLLAGSEAYAAAFGSRLADGIPDFWRDVPPEYISRLRASPPDDVWAFGYYLVHPGADEVIGLCSFKGPPDETGTAEIAYAVAPPWQGRGFATEAVGTVAAHFLSAGLLRAVRAHTLPEISASTAVLTKCGFLKAGEVNDPDDGLVWRWERTAGV